MDDAIRSASPANHGATVLSAEVARLIVDRMTTARIAAELFLSRKTVETHIRHLFDKLGVSSRVEVARTIGSLDRDARAAPR